MSRAIPLRLSRQTRLSRLELRAKSRELLAICCEKRVDLQRAAAESVASVGWAGRCWTALAYSDRGHTPTRPTTQSVEGGP
ncbi:unnamed protein product [Lota lota]